MKEYTTKQEPQAAWNAAEARMSFFRRPIRNKWPTAEPVTLAWVYNYLCSPTAIPETYELQRIENHEEARAWKQEHFDYVTPSGVFSYCSDQNLVLHSQLLCIDLDDLGELVEEYFKKLLADTMFETLLLFRSPSGQGLKWFIHIDLTRCDHRMWFRAVRNYLMATYGLTDEQVDKSCSNPSRGCFLGHDPQAFLNPKLIVKPNVLNEK